MSMATPFAGAVWSVSLIRSKWRARPAEIDLPKVADALTSGPPRDRRILLLAYTEGNSAQSARRYGAALPGFRAAAWVGSTRAAKRVAVNASLAARLLRISGKHSPRDGDPTVRASTRGRPQRR